jgi:hypothetical protein
MKSPDNNRNTLLPPQAMGNLPQFEAMMGILESDPATADAEAQDIGVTP